MKILLNEWAKRNFDPAPGAATLRAWAKSGQIHPLPMKVGRAYYVDDDAIYRPIATPAGEGLSPRAQSILVATA